ncbi:retrovirus-related pol polyprotein from transposon TNT 1-94 [Tanacetum coccineum]
MADMMKSSPICLLSKASKTKSWLWHRRLSHLNFGTINRLAKQGLIKGLAKLKCTKDHLCSACQKGKSKKESHPHKLKPSTNEKLQNAAHGSIWTDAVRYLRTDNGTQFLNQTLQNYTDDVGITHYTSTARTPQQNGVVERRNHTLVEAARTRQVIETMNVQFDELTLMASEQLGSGPDLHGLNSGHISSGLVLNKATSTSAQPPTKNDWDLLFQPMFDEYFKNPSAASNPISAATLPSPDTAEASSFSSSSSSTSIEKDAPSPSTSPNNEATNSPLNSTNVELNEEVTEFDSDTFTNPFAPPDTRSAESSSRIIDTSNMHTFQQPPIYTKRWTKDHLLVTIIGDPSKPVSTRRKLSTDALWCLETDIRQKDEKRSQKRQNRERNGRA